MTSIHHLDTSALLRLLLYPDIAEPGSKAVHAFRQRHTGFYTLDLCVGEALNVLKQKGFSKKAKRKVLSPAGYVTCIDRLRTFIKPSHTLHVISCELTDDCLARDARSLITQFKIDFVDAAIVLSARSHRPFHLKRNLLITAEKEMALAAEHVGMPVWRCNADSCVPPNDGNAAAV
jgi:predicted nucleic acid-binding protein